MLDTCGVCGSSVPFRHTVHVILNAQDDAGVVDYYVCRSCYEAELAPLFDAGDEADEDDSG